MQVKKYFIYFLNDVDCFYSVQQNYFLSFSQIWGSSNVFHKHRTTDEGVEGLFYYLKVCTGSIREITEHMTICTIHFFTLCLYKKLPLKNNALLIHGKNKHTHIQIKSCNTHINKYQHQHSLTATTNISTAKNINSLHHFIREHAYVIINKQNTVNLYWNIANILIRGNNWMDRLCAYQRNSSTKNEMI